MASCHSPLAMLKDVWVFLIKKCSRNNATVLSRVPFGTLVAANSGAKSEAPCISFKYRNIVFSGH